MRRAALLYNPSAGRGAAAAVAGRTRRGLESTGWAVTENATERAGHAVEIARFAARGTDLVVVVGGDGTLREAAEGVLLSGMVVPLGLIPAGNANVVANGLGIPLVAEAAIAAIDEGACRSFDAMQANGRIALAMVGVGFDARVTSWVAWWRRTSVGRRWYGAHSDSLFAILGSGALLCRTGRRLVASLDGNELPTVYRHAVVSNLASYAKGWSVSPVADPSDGRVQVQLRWRSNPLTNCLAIVSAARRRPAPRWVAVERTAERVEIVGVDRQLLWQLDGDAMPAVRRLEITIRPLAIRIVAP